MPETSIPIRDASHRDAADDPGAGRVAWLLTDDRPGHRTQVVGLARDLGIAWQERRLVFNRLNRLPNQILGASLLSVDLRRSDACAPPWPDLVIGMGRRIVPVARWIRRRSGGRTRIVLLGRKAANDPRDIDLTVACAHFRLLPHPALVELTVPPTQVDDETLAAARAAHPGLMDDLPRPRILLLVGGPTAQHRLDAGLAGLMAREVAAATRALGGGLAIVTSRRTPADALAAIRTQAPEAHLHAWRRDRRDNPYLAYLASADLIVVTGESESMLAEAAATRRPLTIYPLAPRPPGARQRLAITLRRGADRGGPWGALCRGVLSRGWIATPRDLDVMHRRMVEQGLADMFATGLRTAPPEASADRSGVVRRIAALMAR